MWSGSCRGPGGIRDLQEACRIHFHISCYLSHFMVPTCGQKTLWGIYSLCTDCLTAFNNSLLSVKLFSLEQTTEYDTSPKHISVRKYKTEVCSIICRHHKLQRRHKVNQIGNRVRLVETFFVQETAMKP